MALMRLFFGVPVAPVATAALEKALATVPKHRGWRPVAARNWHITLSFLGETEGRLVDALVDLGEQVAAAHEAAAVTLDSLQWWPTEQRPRLIAAVASDSSPLQAMRKQLNAGLRALGVAFDSKPLRAHVTLLRLERGIHVLDTSLPPCAIDVPAEALVLYVSDNAGGEKVYRPLWQQPFVAPPPFAWPR